MIVSASGQLSKHDCSDRATASSLRHGLHVRSTSSLDALMATGSFSLEPYMEDDIGLVDSEVFQLMLRS